jgi:N-methylhydantoinase B
MEKMSSDPIRLEVFKHLFASIAEEMGVVLKRSSYSPNIKERRDYSCAVFDASGRMIAQAAHIPVHLGSMPLSVATAIEEFHIKSEKDDRAALQPGDAILLNDPYRGGTHLPDITLVSPVFIGKDLLFGFVASRAHHADVGGLTAGSMPIAREIYQEGLIIPPLKLIERGVINVAAMDLILANVRTPQEREGDLHAQIAANQRGIIRLQELVDRYGRQDTAQYMDELLAYSERMMRHLLAELPSGTFRFTDYLDNDGLNELQVPISVSISIFSDQATVDFSGSAPQQQGSMNAVFAITLSAVYYAFRCLLSGQVPNNSGCLEPIQVIAPAGSVVNAISPAPVAGGNVETSQRIVDVLFGALAQACPERVPAASQGTMNNITIGGRSEADAPFAYYETLGGGMGARPWADGPSAIHSHMTNTLNTPIEAVEYAYPLRVLRYEIRSWSGGAGRFRGGDGLIRDIEMLVDAEVSLITERRKLQPYGLQGGAPGFPGENILKDENGERKLPGKGTFYVKKGDVLSIRTPGGGGHGTG